MVAAILEPSERIERLALAVGCTLVLTDRRLLIVRDGPRRRTRTGIQSYGLDRDLVMRIGLDRRTVSLQSREPTTSMFVRPEHLAPIDALLTAARLQIGRA